MNITLIGGGYVGLVSAACFAEMGNAVVCADNDAAKVAGLQAGVLPIHEPGLAKLVQSNAARGQLRFTADTKEAIAHGEVIFIAVGTPPREDGSADLHNVLAVAQIIGEFIGECIAGGGEGIAGGDYKVIATKSTVPVGTTKQVRECIAAAVVKGGPQNVDKQNADAHDNFAVLSNPEFLKQGAAVQDFMRPDRIIIGVDAGRAADSRALEVMGRLYAPFNRNHDRMLVMDIASAELAKYAANAMLATRISFMNEIANLAERLGADIESVRAGIGSDPRIGYAFLYAGCGYGGSCFPKDVRALCKSAADENYDARILSAVEEVNEAQKRMPVQKLMRFLGDDLRDKKIAVWGLAFKAETDDMRAAPSRVVLEELWRRGATVAAFDPAALPHARKLYAARCEAGDLRLQDDDPYAVLHDADALIVMTEWRVLRAAEPARIAAAMRGDVVVDARNVYDANAMRAAGLRYCGIGRR